MSEPITPNKPEVVARKPWQPLEFEKIAVADAQSGFIGSGADNGFYS